MKLKKYTFKQLKKAIRNSNSLRQTLIQLGVSPYGGNYDVLKKAIKHYDLNISHFSGQAWNKGKSLEPRRSLEQYLNNEAPIQSNKLRNRLLKQEVFPHQCSLCKRKKWFNLPIPLELDHINGDNKNNNLSNLRLLCPNCHAQTATFRGRKLNKA